MTLLKGRAFMVWRPWGLTPQTNRRHVVDNWAQPLKHKGPVGKSRFIVSPTTVADRKSSRKPTNQENGQDISSVSQGFHDSWNPALLSCLDWNSHSHQHNAATS